MLCAVACIAFGLQILPGCCLIRPTDAKILVEAGNSGWRTPEAAFETFRAAFGAELTDLEFRSLSANFRREHQVSYSSYLMVRKKLIDSQPYLAFLANAKVVEGTVISASRHRLTLQAAGRRFEVELVREDWFQIYSGGVFLADGLLDFTRAVQVSDSGTGKLVTAEVRVADENLGDGDLLALTSLRIEQVWKIDNFADALAP